MRNVSWQSVSFAVAVWCACWMLGQAAASWIEAQEHDVSLWDALFVESWKQ